MINSPEYLYTSSELMDYVENYWIGFENAYTSENGYNSSGKHYSQLADIDSMVKYWQTMGIMENEDAVWRRRYAYKDIDKQSIT